MGKRSSDIRRFTQNRWTWDATVSRFEQQVLEECHARGLHPFTKVPMNLTFRAPVTEPVTESGPEIFIVIPDQLYVWFSGMTIPPEQIDWFADPMLVNRALVVELRGPPHRKASRYLHDMEEARRLGMIPEIEFLPIDFTEGTRKEFRETMMQITNRVRTLTAQHGPTACVTSGGEKKHG